jgi:group II intron reverse transcriptase/maturase
MVKARLLKVYYPLSSTVGNHHCKDGMITTLDFLNLWKSRRDACTGHITNMFKDKNKQPKEILRIKTITAGLPKESNFYGNRISIVPVKFYLYAKGNSFGNQGRDIARNFLQTRFYSSVGTMVENTNINDKLKKLYILSKTHPNVSIDKNLYNFICDPELLKLAYENLKSKPGNMTPAINPTTLDGFSLTVLNQIISELKTEKFQFKAGRWIFINKKSGGLRPLTILAPRDKIVLEAIRLILNSIYEPLFLPTSHGFRPNHSCHTALKFTNQKFQASSWILEGDISNCFDSINHGKLMKILEDKIQDRKFTKLIWKSLRSGHFEFAVYKHNIIGAPQGSVISPILANIYLHQLDVFIHELKLQFDKGTESRESAESNRLRYEMRKAKLLGDIDKVKSLHKQRMKISWSMDDREYKKLAYVRYADDWIIGIKGSHTEAIFILNRIKIFLESIHLKLSETKTKLTDLKRGKILFLGVIIKKANHTKYVRLVKTSSMKWNPRRLRFEAPLNLIYHKLNEAGFMKWNKSHPKFVWMSLDHNQIIHLYNSVFRGYLNYYSFVHNYGKLVSYLGFILKSSAAKLLAAKYSLKTINKVIKKFGPNLSPLSDDKTNNIGFIKPSYKISLEFKTNNIKPLILALFGSKSKSVLDKAVCAICESQYRVEMHHIRALKDLNPKLSLTDRFMAMRKRKQIPLCRECHMKKHFNKINQESIYI